MVVAVGPVDAYGFVKLDFGRYRELVKLHDFFPRRFFRELKQGQLIKKVRDRSRKKNGFGNQTLG
jgi:hypothetical protein